MFYGIAEKYQETFRSFALYPSITDRTAWEGLDEEWKSETLALGESYLHFDFPPLTATDFMDFTRTGNRVRYETKCFSKRHALNALILAECVENKGRFLDDII
ncbi:MAG: heparinase, partial [Lachnospiraceae bacterium]|nr:heparinase [Lachnospiraceae bacterium]